MYADLNRKNRNDVWRENSILSDSSHQKWAVFWLPSNLFNILPSSTFPHCTRFHLILCRCVFKWNYAECTVYGNETDGILNLFSLSIFCFHFFFLVDAFFSSIFVCSFSQYVFLSRLLFIWSFVHFLPFISFLEKVLCFVFFSFFLLLLLCVPAMVCGYESVSWIMVQHVSPTKPQTNDNKVKMAGFVWMYKQCMLTERIMYAIRM